MVEFILPASFQPLEFLSGRLIMRADDARWLVSTILRKTADRDTDIWGCVRLHSDILRRIMNTRDAAAVVRSLEAGGAIETYGHSAGQRSKGYRLAARFLGDRCVRQKAVNPLLIDRVEQERRRLQEEQKRRWRPVHHALAEAQRGLSLTPEADALLDDLPYHSRLCQSVLVDRLRQGEFSFSVSSTGRVFNAITGLKRELRTALRFDGQRMGSVDICCAQPALLAALITKHTNGQYPTTVPKQRTTYKLRGRVGLPELAAPLPALCPGLPPLLPAPSRDTLLFSSLAGSGSLYEFLSLRTRMDRSFVKLRFLVDVLAKRGRYPSNVENVFRAVFPTVYRFIRAVNREDHGELIRLLQRAESSLVVGMVAPRLMEGGCPVVTLHDAVYSALERLDRVAQEFCQVQAELGMKMSLKREPDCANG